MPAPQDLKTPRPQDLKTPGPQESEPQDASCDVTARVWRDEQPGDVPTLNLSAICVPREPADAWREPRLESVEIQAEGQRWVPRASELVRLAGGGFEIKAQGDPTLPAGAMATGTVTLQTAAGSRHIILPATKITRVE